MLIKKGDEYEPQTLNDIIFGNYESKCRIFDIVTGAESLPSSGKSAVLLYGVHGTGKTALANLLPDAIEKGKVSKPLNMAAEFIGCQQGLNGIQVMDLISKILNRTSLNESGIHYIILDEVDMLTKLAQESLKSATNTKRGIFIFTTNNISSIDKGILDRSVLIDMNGASEGQLLPFARRIAEDMNAKLPDDEILPTIKAANGSFRNLKHNVERYIRRKNMPSQIIF